jgi:ABC-type branched-subunit amino acid transport system substrate-binding protein
MTRHLGERNMLVAVAVPTRMSCAAHVTNSGTARSEVQQPMLHRRHFLGACVAGGLAMAGRPREGGAVPISRLGHLTVGRGEVVEAVRRGAAIGRAEALQTAQLLRFALEVESMNATDAATAGDLIATLDKQDVLGVVVGGDAGEVDALVQRWPASGPVLLVTAPLTAAPCGKRIFTAAPTTVDRATALAAWRNAGATPNGAVPSSTPRVSAWSGSLTIYGADSLNERFRKAWDVAPDEVEWLEWFAIKALAESAMRSRAASAVALTAALAEAGFDGHKGQLLRFDSARHLQQPLYVVSNQEPDGDSTVWYTSPGVASAASTATSGRCR